MELFKSEYHPASEVWWYKSPLEAIN